MNLNTSNTRSILAVAVAVFVASAAHAQYAIRWSTLDGGGARVSAGAYRLQGTLAQPDATAPRSAPDGTTLTGGFWAAPPPSCTGDFNSDRVVNTSDLVVFLGAFSLAVPIGTPTDLTGDGVVNTADLVVFLGRFGQPCPQP
ncbi:MAG: GC-type dockerin domain-anchored protein [Phycisphaerales bacterium]